VWIVLAWVLVGFGPGRAFAQEGGASSQTPSTQGGIGESTVDRFYGELGHRISVQVPGFHGIEPKLSFQHRSSAPNGVLGVGWSLDGFSVIERASPGRGAPAYDSSDVYLLDGQTLVPCASGSVSPSCTTCPSGMTCYSTKMESYTRIAFDNAAGTWTVTTKNGTRSTFANIYGAMLGETWYPWRYGLTSVQDTHGNTVSYNWYAGSASSVGDWGVPKSVTYNGTTVQLYWEARPDLLLFATGFSYLGAFLGRIKTIDVTVGGACPKDVACPYRTRAYSLGYATSGNTAGSLLSSVKQYGKDATLNESGTVTGGTSLPATTVGYSSLATSIAGWSWSSSASYASCQMLYGDFDGDGMTDIYCHRPPTSTAVDLMALSTGSGLGEGWTWSGGSSYAGCQILLGDFNGDGKTDLYCHRPSTDAHSMDQMAHSTGTGFTHWTWTSPSR
jgi:hypothetical protein